ncbi:MAG: restriction endonuclease subunit S [Lachnospiraceae bacterium]
MTNWEEQKFGDLYLVPSRNGLTRPSSVRGAGYKFINMGEIFAYNRIGNIETELVQLNEKEKKKMTLQKNDLLFARQSLVFSGAGKCSIMLDVEDVVSFESHLIRVRLNPEIANPMFYYYYFSLPYNSVKTIVQQCAQAGIRGSDLEKIKVPCPHIEVQNQIADVLSTYDDLIEANNRRIELLEQTAQELYKEWFVRFRFPGHEKTKFENGLPEGWEYCRLSKIMSFGAGKTRPDSGEEYPVYGGNGILDYCDYYNNENAIIIGRVGAYCGTVYYEPDKCWISDNALFAESKNNAPFYNYYVLKNMNLNARQVGTGQPLITQGLLNKIKVSLAPEPIVNKYNQIVSDFLKQQDILRKQNANLSKERDMLLPRLMSGKLEV